MSYTFKEFYQSQGLKEFPFNTFTTEQESDIAKQIFVSQGEYDPIIDAFKSKRSIIILGERGSGKTAILEDFKRVADTKRNIIVTIHDYSNLAKIPHPTEIYRLLITNFLFELFDKTARNPFKLLFLNKEEKVLLSYLLSEFLPQVSQNLLRERVSEIQTGFIVKTGNYLYNKLRGPLNLGGTVVKNITYQYLLKHFSFLPLIENENQIQEFFSRTQIKC